MQAQKWIDFAGCVAGNFQLILNEVYIDINRYFIEQNENYYPTQSGFQISKFMRTLF